MSAVSQTLTILSVSHTNKCTSISYINLKQFSLKTFTLKHSYCSDMFRQHIACHPQGALMILPKITIKHEHSSGVRGLISVPSYIGVPVIKKGNF